MRLLKVLFVLLVVVAAVAAFLALAPFGPSTETFVEIAPGTGTAGIAHQLQQAGIIRSAAAFEAERAVLTLHGHAGTLKAGEYRFDRAASMLAVYDRLRRGDVFAITLVVPEGFNLFDIADEVQRVGLGPRTAFLAAAAQHTELIRAVAPHAPSLEGYLFPDTYRFSRHATPLQMLTTMTRRFTAQMQRLGVSQETAQRRGFDMNGLITFASLVEKEVHLDTERPMVAGVFQNRLALVMPLQTDPAVVYASQLRGTWTGVIHQSELHSDSPYNTYAHTGLPPGPICNPGIAAITAALHPTTTDNLYFVANADGTTRFARSLAEHNSNVAAYREANK